MLQSAESGHYQSDFPPEIVRYRLGWSATCSTLAIANPADLARGNSHPWTVPTATLVRDAKTAAGDSQSPGSAAVAGGKAPAAPQLDL